MNKELHDCKMRLEDRDECIAELRANLADVECKNRQLNDKVNEIIYNKATMYKEKTLDALRRPKENVSPNGRARCSDVRLA